MQTARLYALDILGPEIIDIGSRLDSGTMADMERNAKLRMQVGAQQIILDCGALSHLTAIGMHGILAVAKVAKEKEVALAVCNLQGQARKMFHACGFDEIISVYNTQDEAVAQIAA